MGMKLTDILTIDQWKALEDDIHDISGLEVNVFNVDGIRITDNKRWVNKICPAVKADDRGQSFICAVAHMNLAAQAQKTGQPVISECDGGLLKAVVPIFIDKQFIGAVAVCGLLLDDGEVDTFMINRTIGMPEAEIEALSQGIASVSTEKMEALVDTIQKRLDRLLPPA